MTMGKGGPAAETSMFHRSYILIAVFLAVLSISVAQECPDEPAINMLFFGNSYTLYNGLQNLVGGFLSEHFCETVNTDQYANNGGQLPQYVESGAAADALERQPYWTYVQIQEQSQIPGMWRYAMTYFEPSLNAVIEIDEMVKDHNPEEYPVAQTILYSTWGHRDGDNRNANMWPSFLPMNHMLAEGYRLFQDALIENDDTGRPPAMLAPAGLAFEIIYNQTREDLIEEHGAGASEELLDPAQSGTDFHGLYQNDGRHPALEGSYLAACVIYATLVGYTGDEPIGMTYAPDGISDERREYLQSVCQLAIITNDIQVEIRNEELYEEDDPVAPEPEPVATAAPTAEPEATAAPTAAPTAEPTAESTPALTRAPTPALTRAPSASPTTRPDDSTPTEDTDPEPTNPTTPPTDPTPTEDTSPEPTSPVTAPTVSAPTDNDATPAPMFTTTTRPSAQFMEYTVRPMNVFKNGKMKMGMQMKGGKKNGMMMMNMQNMKRKGVRNNGMMMMNMNGNKKMGMMMMMMMMMMNGNTRGVTKRKRVGQTRKQGRARARPNIFIRGNA